MSLIVQKYGGTSVGDINRIKNVAAHIKETYEQGHKVVVVVSARSGVTDDLIAMAKSIHHSPSEREMDMLMAIGEQESIALTSIALHAMGVSAVSQTGAQAGILTDYEHTRARIKEVKADRIQKHLDQNHVVIVAGFQGVTPDGEITTLGRGGSDLTAIALAAALKADRCQIYTDVEGVFTADPRIVPQARRIPEISYDELLELASLGFKVMQPNAVEFAQRYNVSFEVLSSFNNHPGTLVKSRVPSLENVSVTGVAFDKNQTSLTVADIEDKPGQAAKLFHVIAEENIIVDMIIQNTSREGRCKITFTVNSGDAEKAKAAAEKAIEVIGSGWFKEMHPIAKISIVGVGMRLHTGVASRFFKALAEGKINIQMISTSEIKISAAVDQGQAEVALQAVHQAFELEREPIALNDTR